MYVVQDVQYVLERRTNMYDTYEDDVLRRLDDVPRPSQPCQQLDLFAVAAATLDKE
jgi:hypothetical protein